jgi:hypothetical protein
MPLQAHPTFQYRKRSRSVLDTAEEAYLRVDIPCGSPACSACSPTLPALGAAPRHLVLPDAAVLGEFLEVFELPDVEDVVLLSSVLRQVSPGHIVRIESKEKPPLLWLRGMTM